MPTPTGYTSAYTSTEIDERLGAVPNKADKIAEVNHGTSDTTFTLTPNVMHIWGTVASLNLSLPTDSNSTLDEYLFTFTSGSTPTTLTLPASIKWIQDPEFEENKTYQISIVNGLAGFLTNGMVAGSGGGGGGENNVIESISVNGVAQTVSNKNVDLLFKTINNESISGSGNITIQGGGDTNVIEVVKVNGTALTPDSNKAVDVPVPTTLSGLTDDSTHRVVTDTEKSTWNSKAEIFIQDIDCSNLVDGEKTISGTTIYNAIDAAYRAGKQVWVRWTNGAQPLQPMIPLTMYDAQFGYAFGYNLINDNMQLCYMVNVTTGETDISWVQLGLYSMPSGGIPSSHLASAVQTSLGKADTALQSYTETDPTVPSWAKQSTKPSYTASEVGAVPTSRTVNGKALSSNISLSASDVGALPNTTTIPTKVSDLTNDENFVSSDNTVAIYSGSSAPSSSTGKNGDIYIQTS